MLKVCWKSDESPLVHPSFKSAKRDGNTFYVEYPKEYSQSRKAKEFWVNDTQKHLRSWGIESWKED